MAAKRANKTRRKKASLRASKPRKPLSTRRLRRTSQRKAARRIQKRVQKRTPAKAIKRRSQATMPKSRALTTRAPKPILSARANLLVTFDPNKSSSAREEIIKLLREVNEEPRIEQTGIHGLFKVTVKDAKQAVRKLQEICRSSPERFVRTFHWTPIEHWCAADISVMQQRIQEISKDISDDEHWKLDIRKRNFETDITKLILKLTEKVDKPNVDLNNPSKIITVDILGKEAGISLLNKEELLNVQKLRASN